jgi:hypothetical protein
MAATHAVRTTTYGGSDHSWLGSQHGTTTNRPVTLDLSKFDFATDFTSGMIPSGVVLGKISASGLYGPYDDALSTGVEVAKGFLFTDVDVRAHIAAAGSTTLTGLVAPGAMLITGIVVEANLPTNHGLDAAAKTDLKNFAPAAIQFV